MQPSTNINITNNVEVTYTQCCDEKHIEKAQLIADKILKAKDKDKSVLNIPVKGLSKKIIKKLLLDLLPELTLKIITKIPLLLRIIF
jgi:hypothetical protein